MVHPYFVTNLLLPTTPTPPSSFILLVTCVQFSCLGTLFPLHGLAHQFTSRLPSTILSADDGSSGFSFPFPLIPLRPDDMVRIILEFFRYRVSQKPTIFLLLYGLSLLKSPTAAGSAIFYFSHCHLSSPFFYFSFQPDSLSLSMGLPSANCCLFPRRLKLQVESTLNTLQMKLHN